MNWLTLILNFVKGMPMIRVIAIGLVAMLTVGVNYKWFYKKDNKYIARDGGTINVCEKEVPLVGCSIHRFKAKVIYQ
jgi:hypothetical protein